MEIETKQHNILKDILSCLNNYTDEINIKFSDIGITINCIDRSNICIIRIKLLKLIFTRFEFKEGEKISIFLQSINKILGKLKIDDTLNIKEIDSKLLLTINNNKKFSLGLLDEIKEEFPEEKQIEYDIEIDIDKEKTCEYIDDLSIIQENGVKFILSNKKLTLSKNSINSKGEITLKDNINTEKTITGKYTEKYIINYSSIMKLGNSLKLRFKDDSPIILISELKNCFKSEFILAPLVEND